MTETGDRNDPHGDFEKQFANKEIFYAISGEIVVTDVFPENPKTEIPVLFAAGIGATSEVGKEILRGFTETGRRALTIDHDRVRGGANITEQTPNFHKEALRKAQAMIVAIESKGLTSVDVVGHSEGALVTAVAALMRPELFRNIVFVDPAGLVGKDSIMGLVRRQLKENKTLSKLSRNDREMKEVLKKTEPAFVNHIVESKVRFYDELDAVTSTEIGDIINTLSDLGIGISVVGGEDDLVFPYEVMEKIVTANIITDVPLIAVPGKHNEIQYRPETYTKALDQILDSSDKKRLSRA